MQRINLSFFLIFETVWGGVVAVPCPHRVNITKVSWKGVVAYIAVDKQAVQEKLDAFYNIEINGQRAPKLCMPITKTFNTLTTDQHVVYAEFGFIDSLGFAGEPPISSHGSESTINIPYLAACSEGVPKYALVLNRFYQRDRGAVARPNIGFPLSAIDEISVNGTGALWRNGSDELRVTFVQSSPCKAASKDFRIEFDALIDGGLDFSFSGPDLDYCDHHSMGHRPVCNILKNIRPDVEKAGPNVCQFYQTPWEKTCDTAFDNIAITDGFRRLLLLKKDDPINVVASEGLYGEYEMSLQYPCIE